MTAPSPADQLRRHHVPPAPTSMKNGAAKTTVSRAVHASPNSRPVEELAPIDRQAGSPRRGSGERIGGDGVMRAGRRLRRLRRRAARHRLPQGRARIARPTASIVRPTATMCAWYHVVASWAVYQKTVPKAKKIVVASRTGGRTGSRPSIHQQIATSDCGKDREQGLIVGGEAPDRHERHEQQRREGREREQAARHAIGRSRRAGRPGSRRCRGNPPSRRPGSGSPRGPRGMPRPATRNGRRYRSVRVAR